MKMDIDLGEDLSQPLPLLGIYSSARPKPNFWAVAYLLIGLCVTTSLFLSYYFYNKLHFGGKKSWTRAINILSPIRKRLQNLEKERAIWKYYLHWMEDYFFLYCDLLRFLNKTTLDVEKIYKDYMTGLSQVASTGMMSDSTENMSKVSGVQSCSSLESLPSEEDLRLISCLPRVLAQMASEGRKERCDDVKPVFDSSKLYASDATSGDETNEESNENESESIPAAPHEHDAVELMDMEFLRGKHHLTEDELYAPLDCSTGIDVSEP